MKPDRQKGFDAFWDAWPKRVAKKDALRAWERIAPEKYPRIMAALDRQKKLPAWQKAGGMYVPYPATWLNGERWEDEISLPEDHDIEVLIAAISEHPVMPQDLPRHIADRFFKMCMRLKTNWPELHIYTVRMEEEACAYIRKEFLATNEKK